MVEGSGPEQMSPELENKAFSAKSTQYMALKCHKESYNTSLRLANEVCSSYRVNRQTDGQTHRTTAVTLRRMHAPRVNNYCGHEIILYYINHHE